MRWQNLTDYFSKIDDMLTFKLPERVHVPTLFIASPKGYLRSPRDRKCLSSIFINSRFLEVSIKTHNIVPLASHEIVALMRPWLAEGGVV